jgi:hypothetical protein
MRARHFAEIGPADDDVHILGCGLGMRQTDAGNLGNGVYARRHQTGEGRRRQSQRHQRGAPALIGGGTGQRRRADGIAGGKYSGNIRFKEIADLHGSARADVQAQPVESNALEIGDSTEGCEHDV